VFVSGDSPSHITITIDAAHSAIDNMGSVDMPRSDEEKVVDATKPITSSASDEGNNKQATDSIDDEPVPHLHAKTFLTVFAVCFIYFAQLVNVVGAGAVSDNHCPNILLLLLHPRIWGHSSRD